MRSLSTTLFLAFLLPVALTAQTLTDNTIELTVTDTVPVRVSSITYQVTPQDPDADKVTYDDNTDYDKVMKDQAERMGKVTEKLKKDLEAQHFTLTDVPAYSSDPYTISGYNATAEGTAPSPLQVQVKDENELKRLVSWLRTRGGVDGTVTRWDYDRTATGGAVMQALFTQAQKQAQQLATLGGRKLGKLLSARDPDQREMTFQDFLRLMADRDHGSSDTDAMSRIRLRSMTFRFALTD